MTVHTIRQVKALQRAQARWQPRPANHLQLVRVVAPRPTLGDRIAALSNRIEHSRITWALIGVATAVTYIAVMAINWPQT